MRKLLLLGLAIGTAFVVKNRKQIMEKVSSLKEEALEGLEKSKSTTPSQPASSSMSGSRPSTY
jgi:hypothetical protein